MADYTVNSSKTNSIQTFCSRWTSQNGNTLSLPFRSISSASHFNTRSHTRGLALIVQPCAWIALRWPPSPSQRVCSTGPSWSAPLRFELHGFSVASSNTHGGERLSGFSGSGAHGWQFSPLLVQRQCQRVKLWNTAASRMDSKSSVRSLRCSLVTLEAIRHVITSFRYNCGPVMECCEQKCGRRRFYITAENNHTLCS